ncbi:hypothetical protein LKF67_0407 [Lactococcus lactis subsp. lactis]|uniref:hypothetical protein n=1 Tax=Lactococcus lactis TaxID=1358 RepID=UPI00071D5A50|nr:hypothetical protein [Lactococcus lactis]KST94419.1 hypothetical protein LKF67_0407 [Lactococcus lactis subsp. lactis]
MIYNFSNHSFSYEAKNEQTFSLVLDTLELEYNLETGKLIDINGYLPLASAQNIDISIPPVKSDIIQFEFSEADEVENGDAFDIFDEIPEMTKYFIPKQIVYDRNKGIIKIGADLTNQEKIIKINKNILCGLTKDRIIKCIYLIPDKFIY